MKYLLQALAVLMTAILLWWLIALLVDAPTLPSPFVVIANLVKVLPHGLLTHIIASCGRVFVSAFCALLIGIPLGILIGYKAIWHTLLSPFIYFSYPVPKLALLPVIMLLFGMGEFSKVLMIFLIIFFPVVMEVIAGVKGMDREMFEVMKSYGVRGRTICARIIFPGLWAPIINSVKVTVGIAFSVLIFAENYTTQYGVGYYIMNSWQKWAYVDLYTGVFTLALVGFIIFMALDLLEKQVTKWR